MGCLCTRPQAIGWPIIYEHNCVELETDSDTDTDADADTHPFHGW